MYEIMIFWTEPNPAGKWRMRSVVPKDRVEANIKTALEWIEEGRATHFTVNLVDDFDNVRNL